MSSEESILDLDLSADLYGEEGFLEEPPLIAFRVIGCTFVTILVGFTIIIYVTSGMTHVDCIAQINAEFCILVAYMLILLTTTEPHRISQNMCISISFFLHICFLGAFFFSFLEAMCIGQVLVPYLQKRVALKTLHVSILGWGCPITIACMTTLIWLKELSRRFNCWVELDKPLLWPTVIPIGICACLHAILLFLIFCATRKPVTVSENQYKRAKSFLGTRWASGIILVTLLTAWTCGVLAYNRKEEALYAAFTVASILLGVCVFILRMSTDQEMRTIISSDLLCCLLPKNRVSSVTVKSIQTKTHTYRQNGGTIPEERTSAHEQNGSISHK